MITNARMDGNRVAVSFSDQPVFSFHSLWLRDSCECPACVHEASNQKVLTAAEVAADIQPRELAVTDGRLDVIWSDGHASRYDGAWLARQTPVGMQSRTHRPILWDGTLAETFPTVSYEDVASSEKSRFEMLRTLVDLGTVRITGVSMDEARTEELAAMVSIIRETPHGRIYDVRTLPNVHNLAFGSDELTVHVDGSYHYYSPGPILFHFIEVSPSGGETILTDGFKVAETLRGEDPAAFDLLCRVPWHNSYINAGMDIRASTPPFGINRDGDLTHVVLNQYTSTPNHFDPDEVEAAYGAWRHAHEIAARRDMQVRFTMPAGDALLFDNRRVLHARTAFDPNQAPRRLRSCYMERDTLHSNLRTLARKLGDPLEHAIFTTT